MDAKEGRQEEHMSLAECLEGAVHYLDRAIQRASESKNTNWHHYGKSLQVWRDKIDILARLSDVPEFASGIAPLKGPR